MRPKPTPTVRRYPTAATTQRWRWCWLWLRNNGKVAAIVWGPEW